MCITAVGHDWGPVILTSARIGSPGPRRFPYSHCGWVPPRPSDSDFSQNWKPRTGEIPLLSLWLGATEAQWFWLQPGLEAWDRGDSPHCGWVPLRPSDSDFSQNWSLGPGRFPSLTVVVRLWGPLFPTSARIGSLGPGRFPSLTVVGHLWGPLFPTSARVGIPGPGRCPYSFQMTTRGLLGAWICCVLQKAKFNGHKYFSA
jgi:hypothetical protein